MGLLMGLLKICSEKESFYCFRGQFTKNHRRLKYSVKMKDAAKDGNGQKRHRKTME